MEVLKERIGSESMNALNCDMLKITALRYKKPLMTKHNRKLILENLMRCAERADIPLELVAAVYFALCYST